MSLLKTTIRLSGPHKDWLEAQPSGLSGTLRELVNKAMVDPASRLAQMGLRYRKDKFLAALRMVFHLRPAMQLADVTDKQLEKWVLSKTENFQHLVKSAQRDFLDLAEGWIIECAQGHRSMSKQAMTGLMALLNNHHPQWGRVKIELLSKIFNPVFDSLLKIVKESVDETTYKAIAEKFQQAKALHFSAFSD